MKHIKLASYGIFYQDAIHLSCADYSTLLDANIKMTPAGLKLEVQYLENGYFFSNVGSQKRFTFWIKKIGEQVDDGLSFLKTSEVLVSDTLEKYFIFFREECSEQERRQKNLDNLGV